jgi:hypothetical protein
MLVTEDLITLFRRNWMFRSTRASCHAPKTEPILF